MKKYSKSNAKRDLPKRRPSDNKTTGGRTLIVAGSKGMWGAAVLTATAAARVGSGYVYLFPTEDGFPTTRHPDFLIHRTTTKLSIYNSVAIGPGCRSKTKMLSWIKKLIHFQNVVLDAEALNALAKSNIKIPESWILTPHEGEMARLIGISSEEIRKDRIKAIKQAQKKFGCVVLLKGNKTLVANSKEIFEIQSGNPALAKAGTGDVLTGIIVGLLAQGLSPTKAATLGAFVHGYAADQWIKRNDEISLLATDLLDALPQIIKKIRAHL